MRPRDRGAVRELVHEDVIADLQRRDHRAAGDLEGLDDERAERHRDRDRDEDRLGVLPDLALAPATEAHVDLAVGLHQRIDEALFVEGLAIHRVLEGVEVDSQLVSLLQREITDDRRLVALEDRLRLLEQRARALERTADPLRQVGTERRMRVVRERQMMPCRPEHHLEEREADDAHRHRLLADPALDPAERAAVIDPARRRERPHEDARERERREHEPQRPVERAEELLRRRRRLAGALRARQRAHLRLRLRLLLGGGTRRGLLGRLGASSASSTFAAAFASSLGISSSSGVRSFIAHRRSG